MALEWKWLRGNFDDPLEQDSFAALKIALGDQLITRIYDRVSGGERDAVHLPLYPLALYVAENWWTLLYEARKTYKHDNSATERYHFLDAYMRGFVFPAITIWSAGKDAVVVETPKVRQQFSSLEFFPPPSEETILPRSEFEQNLFDLVTAVVERVGGHGEQDRELAESWIRVRQSLADEDETKYCLAAGRIGIDPYDPDAADISVFTKGISENLFDDICEAARLDELSTATEWARESIDSMASFPGIDVGAFGVVPTVEPGEKPWCTGYKAARMLRQRLCLEGLSPRRVVDDVFGSAVKKDATAATGIRPSAVEGIVGRRNGTSRLAIPSGPARLRRSTLCRGAYRAWKTEDGEYSAVTSATTLEQQASRAFAAELLAPAEWLRERVGESGLTQNDVEEIAEENICPEQTIIWQAFNHQIPLRGIQPPAL